MGRSFFRMDALKTYVHCVSKYGVSKNTFMRLYQRYNTVKNLRFVCRRDDTRFVCSLYRCLDTLKVFQKHRYLFHFDVRPLLLETKRLLNVVTRGNYTAEQRVRGSEIRYFVTRAKLDMKEPHRSIIVEEVEHLEEERICAANEYLAKRSN